VQRLTFGMFDNPVQKECLRNLVEIVWRAGVRSRPLPP
jgi:hypothetical protein